MMSKNYIKIFIFFILTYTVFTTISCKKGEEDSFISFRSRYARLKGNWMLTNLEETKKQTSTSYLTANNITTKSLDSTITTEIYDGSTWKTIINGTKITSGNPQTVTITSYTRSFAFEMIIDEESIFTKNSQGAGKAEQMVDGIVTNKLNWDKTTIIEEKSTWYWDDSRKSKYGLKSEARILINIPFVMPFTPYNEYYITGDLTKLTNKELIITYQFVSKQNLNYSESEWALTGNSEINSYRKLTFKKNLN